MRAMHLVLLSVPVIIGTCLFTHHRVDRGYGQPMRDTSRMMVVRGIVSDRIAAFRSQHAGFPTALSELQFDGVRWGDEGASARDLDDWHFRSDGRSFVFTWTNSLGAELFPGGRDRELLSTRAEMR